MSVESGLIVVLSLSSTAAAGLAAGVAPSETEPSAERRAEGKSRRGAILLANVMGLPAAAWLIAGALELGAAGVGLVVAAAAPGGSTGPLLASLAGGDPRVAARWFFTLTTAGTFGALAVTMLLAPSGLASVARAVTLVLATSLAPLLGAQWLARRSPRIAHKLITPLARASLVLLVALIALLVVRHHAHASAGPIVAGAILVLGTSALGLVAHGPRATRIAVAQVSTVRNLTLALLVLRAVGAPPEATLAVLGYGLAMYVGAGGVAAWTRYAAPS